MLIGDTYHITPHKNNTGGDCKQTTGWETYNNVDDNFLAVVEKVAEGRGPSNLVGVEWSNLIAGKASYLASWLSPVSKLLYYFMATTTNYRWGLVSTR